MNKTIICRILDRRCVMLHLFTYCLLLALMTQRTSIIEILGGFSPGVTGLNVISIMRWNLCVLTPVMASILYMSSELGRLSIYTVLRSKNVGHWFSLRFFCIAIENLVYLLGFLLITTALGLNAGCTIKDICAFFAVFSVHSTLMSTICITLLIVSKSPKIPLLAFFAVEGGMVIVGSLIPSISRYILPFWGMASQVNLHTGQYLFATLGMSIALLLLFVLGARKYLQNNNPAANARNI